MTKLRTAAPADAVIMDIVSDAATQNAQLVVELSSAPVGVYLREGSGTLCRPLLTTLTDENSGQVVYRSLSFDRSDYSHRALEAAASMGCMAVIVDRGWEYSSSSFARSAQDCALQIERRDGLRRRHQ